jgi:hypothetical protein
MALSVFLTDCKYTLASLRRLGIDTITNPVQNINRSEIPTQFIMTFNLLKLSGNFTYDQV